MTLPEPHRTARPALTRQERTALQEAWVMEVQIELGVDDEEAFASVRAALHALARRLPWDARCLLERHLPPPLRALLEGERTAHDVDDLYAAALQADPQR